MHLTLSQLLDQFLEIGSNDTNPNLEFEFLYSLDSQNTTYDENALHIIYENLERRGFLWNWSSSEPFHDIQSAIRMITGSHPRLILSIYREYFQKLSRGSPVTISDIFFFTLSSISKIYIPYLNSTDRSLTGPIQEIINIHDIEDLNNFLGFSRGYSYNDYIGSTSNSRIGLFNSYLIYLAIQKIAQFGGNLNGIPPTYWEWTQEVELIGASNLEPVASFLSIYKDHNEVVFVFSILRAYIQDLMNVRMEDSLIISETISLVQNGLDLLLNNILSSIDLGNIRDMSKKKLYNIFSKWMEGSKILENKFLSDIYNVFQVEGVTVRTDHMSRIFNVIDKHFPQFRTPGNLEIIRGVYQAGNAPLALFLISNGILDEGSPKIYKRLFRMIYSTPHTFSDDVHPLFRDLGFLGDILINLVGNIPDFQDGVVSLDDIGRLMYTGQRILYNHFFIQDYNWSGLILEFTSNIYPFVANYYYSIGKTIPFYYMNNSVLLGEVISRFSNLTLDYFKNRPTFSFTGLKIFEEIPSDYSDMDPVFDRIIKQFIDMVGKEFNLLRGLCPDKINDFDLVSLSENSRGELVNLFVEFIPPQYSGLLNRLFINIDKISGPDWKTVKLDGTDGVNSNNLTLIITISVIIGVLVCLFFWWLLS